MQKAGIGENPISAYICFGYKDRCIYGNPYKSLGKIFCIE